MFKKFAARNKNWKNIVAARKQEENLNKLKDQMQGGTEQQSLGSFLRPYLENLIKGKEIKSDDLDIVKLTQILNKKEIDYDKLYSFEMKKMHGGFTEEEKKEIDE